MEKFKSYPNIQVAINEITRWDIEHINYNMYMYFRSIFGDFVHKIQISEALIAINVSSLGIYILKYVESDKNCANK